jgi:hypothetical protein
MAAAHYRGSKKGITMGSHTRTPEENEAMLWCNRNNICISPRQEKWGEGKWLVDVEKGVWPNRVRIGTSPESFGPGVIWQKISEYQLYYYKKYAN